MFRACLAAFALLAVARGETLEEWVPYAKTGLFPANNPMWLAPNMEKEPIADFTARLLDAARASDPKAMGTLGQQCQSCHAMYREQFANGAFRIKKSR